MGTVFYYPWNRPVVTKPDFEYIDPMMRTAVNPTGFDALYTTIENGTGSVTMTNPTIATVGSQRGYMAIKGGDTSAMAIANVACSLTNGVTKVTLEVNMRTGSNTDSAIGLGLPNPKVNFMGFEGDATYDAHTIDRSTSTTSTGVGSNNTTTTRTYKIEWTSGQVNFIEDGSSIATHTTNVLADTAPLVPYFIQRGADKLKLHYWRLKFE